MKIYLSLKARATSFLEAADVFIPIREGKLLLPAMAQFSSRGNVWNRLIYICRPQKWRGRSAPLENLQDTGYLLFRLYMVRSQFFFPLHVICSPHVLRAYIWCVLSISAIEQCPVMVTSTFVVFQRLESLG